MSNVYEAISGVMKDLTSEGISKHRKNEQQGYAFRGIDDVYNALSASLVKNGLLILPRVIDRICSERTTQKGSPLFTVVLDVEFDFVYAKDPASKHTVRTVGEAMDTADKASNKAMSAAYKYACIQVFCIPTEADNDADSTTHDVKPKTQPDPVIVKKPVVNHAPQGKVVREPAKLAPAAQPLPPKQVMVQSVTDMRDILADYKIDFGKHTGKCILDLDVEFATGYAKFLKGSVKPGKPMNEKAVKFCEMAELYNSYWDSSGPPPFDPNEPMPGEQDEIPF